MFRILQSAMLAALLIGLRNPFVWAVYDDEAYNTDWQLKNIGHFECVVEAPVDALVVLSRFGDASLLSWINKTSGEVLARKPLGAKAIDMMSLEGGRLAVRAQDGDVSVYDSHFGFKLNDTVAEFSSSCTPNLSGVSIEDHKIRVLDRDSSSLEVFHEDLPERFTEIKFLKTDNAGSLEVLLASSGSEYHFSSFEDGQLAARWSRDESLTDVVAYAYVSAPDRGAVNALNELVVEESLGVWEAYLFRCMHNWRRLKQALLARKFSVGSYIKDMLEDDDEETVRERELKFGLLKYLIVATTEGNVAALNVLTGEKVWSVETGFGDILALETTKKDTELLVFTRGGQSLVLDIADVEKQPVVSRGRDVVPSAKITRIGASDDFYVRAQDGSSTVLLEKGSTNTNSTYVVDHNDKVISAFAVEGDKLDEVWKLELQPAEELLAFAGREDDPVVSVGTILGNRTVLYKYLYPNLAGYAVANRETNELCVNILDTVSGELVYASCHEDKVSLDMPVNMVFGEYWCVYSYFSSEPVPEQKLAVIELYESLRPNKRVTNSSTVQDTLFNEHRPEIITKSYFFPETIKNMILSKTKFGITTKSVVVELANGQMTYLPKYLLNARRVEESKMSKDDQREFMASPYVSGIPVNDHFVLTHFRQVLSGPRSKLTSIPTNLESTSIVCNLGHDLFCTRVAPSSQFDKLSPSFEKGKLVATVVGLLFICYFLRPLVDTKKMKGRWLVKD